MKPDVTEGGADGGTFAVAPRAGNWVRTARTAAAHARRRTRQLPLRADRLPDGSSRPVSALAARCGRARPTRPGPAAEPGGRGRAVGARPCFARTRLGPPRR